MAAGGAQAGGWTLATAIQQADRFIEELGLPQEGKPGGYGKEYQFPDDFTKLTSVELGRWQSRMEKLWSYGLQELGKEDSELQEIDKIYELKVGLRMAEEHGKSQGRMIKDILRAVAIKSDPDLEALTQTLVARRLRVRRLDVQVKIYQSHLVRLSREQSRREAEARIV